jgi:type II secretory pathway component PulM
MSGSASSLPSGRRGQALALGVALVALALIWLVIISPLLAWFDSRNEYLQQQSALAVRMASVAATAPALQQQVAQADAAPPPRAVFEGATDAIAAASLQQAVQDLANHAGATVMSAEMLPPQPVGGYHRLGIRMTVAARWTVLVQWLGSVLQATPRMLVDDVAIQQTDLLAGHEDRPMQASFTVTALHVEAPAPRAAAP